MPLTHQATAPGHVLEVLRSVWVPKSRLIVFPLQIYFLIKTALSALGKECVSPLPEHQSHHSGSHHVSTSGLPFSDVQRLPSGGWIIETETGPKAQTQTKQLRKSTLVGSTASVKHLP